MLRSFGELARVDRLHPDSRVRALAGLATESCAEHELELRPVVERVR
jgi:hypothetical protein